MIAPSSAAQSGLIATPVRPGPAVAALCLVLSWLAGSAQAAETATVQRTTFDHLTTGFELLGQHRDLACESCHVNAIFKGTPRECQACHGVGTSVRASAKPANHLLTTNACGFCHTPVAWNPAVNFSHSEVMGSCASCHYKGSPVGGPGPNHIVTDLDCSVCHSTVGWAGAVFNHNGRTSGCANCHDNVRATGQPASHVPTIPAGAGTCEGCHAPTNYTTWRSVTGTPAIHATAAGWACQSCHEAAQFMGMTPSTATAARDSRPSAALDPNHPTTGDCGICHDTSSFTAVLSLRPANHIPTSAPCAQCHLTPGQNASYSVTGTHQGVTECLSCHAPAVAGTFANVTIVTTPNNHFPIGSLDCNSSGCHSTGNVNSGGFRLGAASLTAPTLSVAGHATVAGQVPACTTCHETAPYVGMIPSTASAAGDSRPTLFDKLHPTTGDCGGCHTTTPTFTGNITGTAKPSNHIPTTAPCTQCHTTANNYALYSVTGTHQGVTNCLSCHAPAVANTFANVTIVSTPNNHFPIGNLDCAGSGCHTTTKVTAGGFRIGAASITAPTLSLAGHTTVAGQVPGCMSCHETAPYVGMIASTSSTAGDSRPNTTLDPLHPAAGECGDCHTQTPTFTSNVSKGTKPANHVPTTATCAQCHTTAGNFALYSVTGTHQGVTNCLSCHGPAPPGGFANITIVGKPSNHFPVGSLDCNGSGCHSTAKVSAGGFRLGAASISNPTLNVAGHATVAGQVAACTSCHETAAYVGMIASTASAAGDSRPTLFDKLHPTTGDCGGCHTTTPTFTGNITGTAKPSNHIPTTAACTQCHTTANNYALYSVTGTHQGVTNCLSCHAPAVANTFANVTIVSTPNNHFPIGNLDCAGSGCHTTTKVTAGGFRIGAASITAPTLSLAGHTTVAGQVAACTTCHETAPYVGMIASTSTTAGDSRPNATLDKIHPTSGDCGGCHTQTPTFTSNVSTGTKPANHIPTTATCAQCHTTAGNFALYSVTGTHQGVTNCLSCHGPPPPGGFANITIVGKGNNHFPLGSLDCNGSGCHSTAKVSAGGFRLGAASISNPTLNVAGHSTVAGQVPACTSCHETAPYVGMIASTSTTAGDSRPNATLDKSHPTTGDCKGCHTTTPTFTGNITGAAKPSNHIPTTAACTQCHTTANNYALYSVTGTHQGVTNCLSCHGPPPPGGFANITIVGKGNNHFPLGNLDCNGSGCHSTAKVSAGGFRIGAASITAPTLSLAGHTTVAGQVPACQTCHQAAPYVGMIASTSTTASDSRPNATLDPLHPAAGDCGDCHTQTPTFTSNISTGTKPANHIPTSATCAQCHTTPGNFAVYLVTGTHQGVTNCLSCHGTPPPGGFANITIVGKGNNHFPLGNLDCNGSGCHSTAKVSAGGFRLGAASITAPTLNAAGHTTVAGQVPACTTCHETAPYVGMIASTSTTAGDSRPNATLDKSHPTSGDCKGCHTTSPTFTGNVTSTAKPSNHIPTNAPCAQCHTTAGNYALYSVTGTHQGVTTCLNCHASNVANTFANVTIVSTPGNHFPIGNLDCNGSGCHTTAKVTAGGFRVGAASITAPTLNAAGHTTVAGQVPACTTCHETAPYVGMIASTSTTAGDSRPNATLDKSHPTTGDCGGCHTKTPTFAGNVTTGAKPSNHIPTTAPCAQCHRTPGNYSAYVMGTTGHAGITNKCATCHAYGLAFANMAPPTLVAPPSGPTGHIPSNPPNGTTLNVACELCHSPSNFTTFAGTIMRHQYVTTMTCMSCHELGMKWKTNTGTSLWVRKKEDTGHFAGKDCGGSGCHSSRDKRALRPGAAQAAGGALTRATNAAGGAATLAPAAGVFNHNRVAGTDCASCHNGASGSGKPADHIATSGSCDSCHNTLAWLPVIRVDHAGLRGTCASCHNGKAARGRSTNHIASNSSCETCHTTNAWTPARFDHAGVVAHTCRTCHDGVHALGLPVRHVPTAAQCDTCHGTLGWKPARLDHTTLTANCASCHNNSIALGVPTGHMTVARDCASCHSYPDWTLLRFTHASGSYPGAHKAAPACAACHASNTEQVPWSSPANAGSCAGCHAKDFKPAVHPKTSGGLLYTANELHDCAGACHVYGDATLKGVVKPQPGPRHRPSDAAFKH